MYAFPSEIDAWRASRRLVTEAAADVIRPWWRVPAFALTVLLCLVMAGNGIRPQAASAKPGPLAKRLICSGGCADSEAGLSQDGRVLVFTDWENGDLAIRDLSTGKSRPLMLTTGGENSDAYAEAPLLSPDRKQILYDWFTGEKGSHHQLRLMPNQPGGKPRVLVDSPEYDSFQPAAWFPDGKSALVFMAKPDRTKLLARVSFSTVGSDGAVKVLKAPGRRLARGTSARISPDGQFIAYSALAVNPSDPPAPADPKDLHIYILAVDGSRETEIVKTAGINLNQVWTPDGKHLLFTSDRSGKNALWSIAVLNGKPAGPESLVSPEVGDIHASGMAGGSYYYTTLERADYVHIAGIAPGGRSPETESFVGAAPTWSPDGKSIAFKRRHPGSAGQYDLVIRSLATGEERTPLAGIGTTGGGSARWFADGGSVFTGVARNNGTKGFYRIDLTNGDLKELFPDTNCGPAALSPDEKTLYLNCSTEGHAPYRTVARDIGTGQERVIASHSTAPSGSALSPDGRTLAISLREGDSDGYKFRIFRVSTDGAGYGEVFTGGRLINGSVAWDRDSRSILFVQGPATGGVMRVPAGGGSQPAPVFAASQTVRSFDISPDRSRIAYSTYQDTSELWALDNVLSMIP